MTRPAATSDLNEAMQSSGPSSIGPRSGDAVTAARNSVIELARALARIAAQEDDAAERNEAGSAARSQPSAKRRKSP
jgi:hypothetical protein